jgi:anti-anti-sigma regulatory factor
MLHTLVPADHSIVVGVFDGFSWIRCDGKGSFRNSPTMKAYAEERMGAGEKNLVIDLDACTGMDSTFMGTLAGMASKLSAANQGGLQIAGADERNRRSLEDLGLDFLMEINPPAATWQDRLVAIRGELKPIGATALDLQAGGAHVLDAHRKLSDINEKNKQAFSTVVSMLEKETANQPPQDGRQAQS